MAQIPGKLEVEIETTIKHAILKPGDTLVIATDEEWTAEEADNCISRIHEMTGGKVRVVVVRAHTLAVFRP